MNSDKIKTEVLIDSFSLWDNLYSNLPDKMQSPFFTSQYYESYLEVEKGTIECFCCYQDKDNFLFYPYLRKEINYLGYDLPGKFYDIAGAYGYNGPLGKVSDPRFINYFNNALKHHLRETNVVTEFVRYCPIINNRIFHTYTNQIDVLDNVYIDLSKGLEDVWNNSFEYRVRKTVKKAEGYNLKNKFFRGGNIRSEELNIFYDIYLHTMNRNYAEKYYLFSISFFSTLINKLREKILLGITYYEDLPVSTELVLMGPKIAYGFLGGTLKEYYQLKVNTYQRWELLNYLVYNGINIYSMGGGASRYDSIYKYKLSFSKNCNNPFFIGTYVHCPNIYQVIQSQWQENYPEAASKYANKIQGYRNLE
jgi:serine/alanine adding enzyme